MLKNILCSRASPVLCFDFSFVFCLRPFCFLISMSIAHDKPRRKVQRISKQLNNIYRYVFRFCINFIYQVCMSYLIAVLSLFVNVLFSILDIDLILQAVVYYSQVMLIKFYWDVICFIFLSKLSLLLWVARISRGRCRIARLWSVVFMDIAYTIYYAIMLKWEFGWFLVK